MSLRPLSCAILGCALIAALPTASSAATHVVTLSQTLDAEGQPVCTVTPERLYVAPGDQVEFDMVTDGKAKKAKVKKAKADASKNKKGVHKLKFGSPPPWEAKKGKPANSGNVQRDDGDAWEYDVIFKKDSLFFPEVCTVDPVICIKDDVVGAPPPDSSSGETQKSMDDPCS